MDYFMTLNPNVNVDTTISQYADVFTPAEGYALWRDNETGNLDENGNPIYYWSAYRIPKKVSEAYAPHIWAKSLSDTDATTEAEQKAAAYDFLVTGVQS